MSHEPLNLYSPVVQWVTVRLILILRFILGLQSQSIYFTNIFSQADIPSGEPVLIENPRYFKSDRGQFDILLRSKKILYGQDEPAHLCYKNLRNGLLDSGFVMIKVDPFMFMYKNMISMVYVDDCLFWERSQYEIDNIMRYLKEDGPS